MRIVDRTAASWSRRGAVSWDFETDPEYQEELDWVDDFVREGGRAARLRDRARLRHERPGAPGADPAAAGEGQGPRPVGLPPRPEPRRPGLRPGQAGAAQRDPRPRRTARRSCSAARRPTPATPRSSPTTAPTSRRSATSSRCCDNEIVSCFSMTEPQGGADPKVFTTRAELDGDEWVINGEKWFSSHANFAVVPDRAWRSPIPTTPPYQQMSMFIVPTDTPGVEIIRNVGVSATTSGRGHPRLHALHRRARSRPTTCSASAATGFVVAQTRLGGGRIHHAMRTVGHGRSRRFDMMCERALSRTTQGEMLGAQAAGAGDDRRLVDRDRAVPPARAAHGVADRQVQGLQAGARRHLGGQGGDAQGAPRRRRAGAADPRLARRRPTRCRSSAMVIESFHMGLADGADRGAQGHRSPARC